MFVLRAAPGLWTKNPYRRSRSEQLYLRASGLDDYLVRDNRYAQLELMQPHGMHRGMKLPNLIKISKALEFFSGVLWCVFVRICKILSDQQKGKSFLEGQVNSI